MASSLKQLLGVCALMALVETVKGQSCAVGKFTIDNALQKVFLDGKDISATVLPQEAFTNWRIAKTVSFDEPFHTGTLAIQGYQYNSAAASPQTTGMMLTCSSTRQGSPWNFVSGQNANWTSVSPVAFNRFPDKWHLGDYVGSSFQVVASASIFDLDYSSCVAAGVSLDEVKMAQKIASPVGSDMFSFKKTIFQDSSYSSCDLSTGSGTATSSKFRIDDITCGVVTCCITADNAVEAVYVDGQDVTSLLTPLDALDDWTRVKQITFTESSASQLLLGVLSRNRGDSSDPSTSGVQVMCTSTRPSSAWNLMISDETMVAWRAVPIDPINRTAPSQWFSLSYLGATLHAERSTSKFLLREPVCGPLDRTRKVASPASNVPISALRATISQTSICTRGPLNNGTTLQPTATPVKEPLSIAIEFMPQIDSFSVSKNRQIGGWSGSPAQISQSEAQSAVLSAAAFWQSAIIKSFPSRACVEEGVVMCGYKFNSKKCFEDILVLVGVDTSLSTPSETMVCAMDASGRPRISRVTFSSQTPSSRLAVRSFGRALGFASLWDEFGLVDPTSKEYFGLGGLRAYQILSESSAKGISLSPSLLHWSDSAMPEELMSANIHIETSPISVVTLSAMKDILYDVNVSLAEPYDVSFGNRRMDSSSPLEDGLQDVIILNPIPIIETTVKTGRSSEFEEDIEKKRARDDRTTYPPSSPSNLSGSFLTTGAIVGIAIGGAFALAILFAILLIVRSRRTASTARSRRSHGSSPPRRSPSRVSRNSWTQTLDVENNTTYWVNRDTGEFSWTNPVSHVDPPPSAHSEIVVMANPDTNEEEAVRAGTWTEGVDESSQVRYFIKPSTGQFSMSMPSSPMSPQSSPSTSPIRHTSKRSFSSGTPLSPLRSSTSLNRSLGNPATSPLPPMSRTSIVSSPLRGSPSHPSQSLLNNTNKTSSSGKIVTFEEPEWQ